MTNPKVLVADDDASIRRILKEYLERQGMDVVVAENGLEALALIKETQPQIVLSDAEMPGLDGHGLCRVLRQGPDGNRVPLILMSGARVRESNVLAGFEGGADDYILKPFSLPVLAARLAAILRRAEGADAARKVNLEGLEINVDGRSVKVDGAKVTLTRKEFDLLYELVSRVGRVLSVSSLLQTVWGYDPADYTDPGTVETHISHLRKKLGPRIAKRIVTVSGFGYKFEE